MNKSKHYRNLWHFPIRGTSMARIETGFYRRACINKKNRTSYVNWFALKLYKHQAGVTPLRLVAELWQDKHFDHEWIVMAEENITNWRATGRRFDSIDDLVDEVSDLLNCQEADSFERMLRLRSETSNIPLEFWPYYERDIIDEFAGGITIQDLEDLHSVYADYESDYSLMAQVLNY